MLGLEGYGSEDSADSSDEHPEHPLVSTSAPQKTAKQGDALPSTSTLALPDAASLFSTTTDSSVPWRASTQHKRAGPAVQTQSAKAQKPAYFASPANQQQDARQRANSAPLLPPQLRGRANASTEDLDRLGLKRVKPLPRKQ